MRVVKAKIEPPAIDSMVVSRPRLEQLISDLLDSHRVLAVTATAGSGKTTAIRQTLERHGGPVAWLSLQPADCRPGRLLTYLAAALAQSDPRGANVVAPALAWGVPHVEVAELLAERVPDSGQVMVIDNAEVLSAHAEALEIIATFVQRMPRSARVVIASRVVLPLAFNAPNAPIRVGHVGEEDLAFSVAEAEAALVLTGTDNIDAADAVAMTGGWVAGVLFEAWSADAHVAGLGGESDPLHGYLATEVLGRLGVDERELLVVTSVLDHVTVELARGLGQIDVPSRMDALRRVRLPVVWDPSQSGFRCHTRFREYLLVLLERRPDAEVRAVRVAHGRLLAQLERWEEATEAFLAVGELTEARATAERAIVDVVVRTDFDVAERWLQVLWPEPGSDWPGAFEAQLLLALAGEEYERGAHACDQLLGSERGRTIVAASPRIAALMAWFYLHVGRLDAIRDVLEAGRIGPELNVVRYTMRLLEDDGRPYDGTPEVTGTPFDALIMRTHYDLGRLELLLEVETVTPWVARAAAPWRVGALLATGRTEQGYELVQELGRPGEQGVWLAEVIGPKLMAEMGDVGGALRRLREGRHLVRGGGSIYRLLTSLLTEAELRLRHQEDPLSVPMLLDEVQRHDAGRRYAFIREQHEMLTGLALLLAGASAEALPTLESAVMSMRTGQRVLWLPAAAVYLAEARWRVGDSMGADEAASIALDGAAEQGTNHGLLQALAVFPEVLSRRLDAEPRSDSEWNHVGRSLATMSGSKPRTVKASVQFSEFGRLCVMIDGTETSLKLKKSYELLALLIECGPQGIPREQLIGHLFGERGDRAASTYLRQATLKLRQAIPGVLSSPAEGIVALSEDVRVHSESAQLDRLRRQAASARGDGRLDALLELIEISDRGEYLPGCTSRWTIERRVAIDVQLRDVKTDAASTAFLLGRARLASPLAETVLREDPFRESMWQLRMRIADSFGDQDAVVHVFRSCEAALAAIGARPSATTVALFDSLRR